MVFRECVSLAVAPGPGLLFGLMLLAAIVGGHAARSLHLPRVIGYLVGGAVLRAVLHGALAARDGNEIARHLEHAAEPLSAIKDLALGIIIFLLGQVFERSRLRGAWSRAIRISLLDVLCSVPLVTVLATAALVLTRPETPLASSFALALLLGVAAIEIAPAATLFVLQEYEAKGPITDTILVMSGLASILCIALFYPLFFMLKAGGYLGATGAVSGGNVLIALAMTTIGSIALGVVLGVLMSVLHAKLPLGETLLVFFAMLIVLGAGESWLLEHVGLSFNFLLASLAMGAVFANVAVNSDRLAESLRTMGAPIFAGFFVIAGYELHLSEVAAMGALGAAYVLGRLGGKLFSGALGVRWAKGPPRVGNQLGSALLCQATIVIGLAAFVDKHWPGNLGQTFGTVVLGGVVIFELIGPLFLKRCVVQGGEVKAVTLLGRSAGRATLPAAIRSTVESLCRLIGLRRPLADKENAVRPLTARHVMRTNVQLIPASATLDEVLGFMERSTYDHFPVILEGGELVGMIHFADVRDVIYDPNVRDLITAYDLADPDSPLVAVDLPLAELLKVFEQYEAGVLPVADDVQTRHVIGIVDQRDVLRAIHRHENR